MFLAVPCLLSCVSRGGPEVFRKGSGVSGRADPGTGSRSGHRLQAPARQLWVASSPCSSRVTHKSGHRPSGRTSSSWPLMHETVLTAPSRASPLGGCVHLTGTVQGPSKTCPRLEVLECVQPRPLTLAGFERVLCGVSHFKALIKESFFK